MNEIPTKHLDVAKFEGSQVSLDFAESLIVGILNYNASSLASVIKNVEELEKQIEELKSVEDAVSRQAVKEQMIKYGFLAPDMTVTEFVEDLPPVTPKNSKRETAKWIRRSDIMSWKWFECDRCTTGYDFATPYCPHCGREMTNSETTYTTSAKEESK